MTKTALTIPEVGLIAATRGMLGAGIGLLVADKLPKERRGKVGRVLLGIGVLSTIPLIADVLRKRTTDEC